MLIGEARNDLSSWNCHVSPERALGGFEQAMWPRNSRYVQEPLLIPQSDGHSCGLHCIAFVEILLKKNASVPPLARPVCVDDAYRRTCYEKLYNISTD
jgi:hypothetical protein